VPRCSLKNNFRFGKGCDQGQGCCSVQQMGYSISRLITLGDDSGH
jgi:hypothetical protein